MRRIGIFWGALIVLALGSALASAGEAPDGADRDFQIGVDDVLGISIWELENLDQVVTVRPDGKVSLQLIGDVRAQGLSVSELSRALQKRYRGVVEGASVTVTLREMRSSSVYFVGELEKTGALPLTRRMTVLQAIAVMGGFTAEADPEAAYVLRGERVISVDFRLLMREPDPEVNIELLPGDTVVVPPGEWTYVQG